jgi:hypothetical protein
MKNHHLNCQEVLNQFDEKVRSLHEVDYGDFKRKVGLYIKRLTESFSDQEFGVVQDLIDSLYNEVIYSGDGNIDLTRAKVTELISQIRFRIERH